MDSSLFSTIITKHLAERVRPTEIYYPIIFLLSNKLNLLKYL